MKMILLNNNRVYNFMKGIDNLWKGKPNSCKKKIKMKMIPLN
jgi:hypothetical protein